MHANTLLITLALTLTFAPLSSAAPLASDIRPTPLLSTTAANSAATGVANGTTGTGTGIGKLPDHEHTPDCEHSTNATHTSIRASARNDTTSTPAQGDGHPPSTSTNKPLANNPSSRSYPGFNASAYSSPPPPPPHAGLAPNHTTGESGDLHRYNGTHTHTHPHHGHGREGNGTHNGTHTHTHPHHGHGREGNGTHNGSEDGCRGTGTEHHHNGNGNGNGNATGGVVECSYERDEHTYNEKRDTQLVPRVDITVCLDTTCKDSTIVTATADLGTPAPAHAKDGTQMAKRGDRARGMEYRDVVRGMDGAEIVGGV